MHGFYQHRIRKTTVIVMAWAVVLGTLWALIRPALTLEQACALEEHTHGDACYEQAAETRTRLRCTFPVHSHEESCRDDAENLICGMADFVIHTHKEYCFDSSGELVCTLPAVGSHEHSGDCYQTVTQRGALICTLHEHSPDCWAVSGESPDPALICAEAESHTHSDACWEATEAESVQICDKEELLPHSHSEENGCYLYENEEQSLICQKMVLLEHDHDEGCLEEITETLVTENLLCEKSEHLHTDACLAVVADDEAPALYSAEAREGDLPVVTGEGIRFRLFNYSLDINKNSDKSDWRTISRYFTFRDSTQTKADPPSDTVYIPSWNMNPNYDADGFTANHATVEWTLTNGLPVLSLTRNPDPDGADRTDPGVSAEDRSLAYLFSAGDPAVTAYSPANTILQKYGNRYYYNSQTNAVDYDSEANLFRLRGYAERNSTTAGYTRSDGSAYGDFLPFTDTGGQIIGSTDGIDYHVSSSDVDYWYGMTMEVDFFQTKDGQIDGGDMVFNFSGDDDVWVFVDDVLVLDLGGTHGTATGSINFATGEVVQYLSWKGGTADSDATSFPTTIRRCFDSAGRTPNGGWNDAGTSLADYTEHTLKFFYLERGAAVANCMLDFRLPTLPDESLTVSKDLVPSGAGEVEEFIADSLSYKFRVVKADENGEATDDLFIQPGTAYTLLSGGSSAQGVVGDDGCFALKAGQSAQFADMLLRGGGAVNYIVQEIMPTQLTGQYAGVEYRVSGASGSIETETGTVQEFTTYDTGSLSAEETQTVTYRNKVDTSQLCSLKLTKRLAPAAQFPEGQTFRIQVKLGGQLLPVGTQYRIDEETNTVTEPGGIVLQIGQTAVVDGILSGTAYEVTELGTADGGFTASYSGIATGSSTIHCGTDGADGEFGLNSIVQITVTNANYAFPGEIPIYKQVLDHSGTETFRFLVHQVEKDTWAELGSLPGTSITVTGEAEHSGTVTIGYDAGTEGVFYYSIREERGTGEFIYDETFYIAEVTVTPEGTAAVTGILKNGLEAADRILFVNRKTTTLLVTKEVTGALYEGSFPFTAAVTLNGEPFPLPQPPAGALYSVSGNTAAFTLSHGQSIPISGIPHNAQVTVTETGHDGFTAYYRVEGVHPEKLPGDMVTVTFSDGPQTVRFLNNGGFQLPETGGIGAGRVRVSGLLLSAAALLCKRKERRGKGDRR